MSKGRPTKYKKEYCDALIEFFDVEPEQVITPKGIMLKGRMPTLERFACEIGVNIDTIHEWRNKHDAFSDAHAHAMAKQKAILIENGLTGGFNARFTQFLLSANHDVIEKTEVAQTGNVTYMVDTGCDNRPPVGIESVTRSDIKGDDDEDLSE